MNEDKSTRHRRLQRRLYLLQTASAILALAALMVWPLPLPSALAATISASATPSSSPWSGPWTADAVSLLATWVVIASAVAPWVWVGDLVAARRSGRVSPGSLGWLASHARQWGMTLLTALPVWLLFQALQRHSPWLTVPVLGVVIVAVSVLLLVGAPWLVTWSPRVTSLQDEALAGRLHALVGRAGLRVAGIHAWRESETSEPNAALIGAGPGRRLLLSAALLERYAHEEIEVVVAHELGHHARSHIWRRLRGMLLAAGLALCAAQGATLLRAGLTGTAVSAPGALPWALMAAGAVLLVMRPRLLTQSRAHEFEADDYSLQLTGRPEVLERILTRVGAHYRAAPDPSPLEAAFFLTHPPVRERVARIRNWEQAQPAPHV